MGQERTHARLWLTAGLAGTLIFAGLETLARSRHRIRASARLPGVTIAALGDSIVAGEKVTTSWPSILETLLCERYSGVPWRVANWGVPGDTAPLGLARFRQRMLAFDPEAVLIAFGLNDCHLHRHALDRFWEAQASLGPPRSYAWRAVVARLRRTGLYRRQAPERAAVHEPRTTAVGFAAALSELVRGARASGARPAILTMTPLDPDHAGALADRDDFYRSYNNVIRRVAGEAGVPLVEPGSPPPGSWLADGVHLSDSGQAWLASEVFRQLDGKGFWTEVATLPDRAVHGD